MLVAFFGVVIGVNMIMMQLAIHTLPGTEVDSAYSASLAYEKEIVAARDQNARNWKVDAHVERSGRAAPRCRSRRATGSAPPMSGLKFQGRFERPTDRRADRAGRRSPRPGSASIAAAPRQSRRANGIWCSKAISAGQRHVPVARTASLLN